MPDRPPVLELPFRPFTFEEVASLSGADAAAVDLWVKLLPVRIGSGAIGLDFMAAFAVFVAQRWRREGAPKGRAEAVLLLTAAFAHDSLMAEFRAGRCFPVTKDLRADLPGHGILVRCPDTTLGRRLNLATLYEEFRDALARVFPEPSTPGSAATSAPSAN